MKRRGFTSLYAYKYKYISFQCLIEQKKLSVLPEFSILYLIATTRYTLALP